MTESSPKVAGNYGGCWGPRDDSTSQCIKVHRWSEVVWPGSHKRVVDLSAALRGLNQGFIRNQVIKFLKWVTERRGNGVRSQSIL